MKSQREVQVFIWLGRVLYFKFYYIVCVLTKKNSQRGSKAFAIILPQPPGVYLCFQLDFTNCFQVHFAKRKQNSFFGQNFSKEWLAISYLQENGSVRRSGTLERVCEDGFPLFRKDPADLDVDHAENRSVVGLLQLGTAVPIEFTWKWLELLFNDFWF